MLVTHPIIKYLESLNSGGQRSVWSFAVHPCSFPSFIKHRSPTFCSACDAVTPRIYSSLSISRRCRILPFVFIKSSDKKHSSFSRARWDNCFNERMNKTYPNTWAFIVCLQDEEVNFDSNLSNSMRARKRRRH
jgi:hypothetical protein